MRLDDMAAVPSMLLRRVAVLTIDLEERPDLPLLPPSRLGYAIPIGPQRVACLAHLLEHGESVSVSGPTGTATASIELDDRQARVAVLRTSRPLSALGLELSKPLRPDDRIKDANVFALLEATPSGTAVAGVIADPGVEERLERLVVTTLDLALGMPVFDSRLRWVGLSRTVGWDKQKGLLIPPEKVEAARAEAEAHRAPPPPPKSERPWWARPPRRR